MEKMLNKRSLQMAHCALNKREEAPISGEYVLPEYCPDIATILKCTAYPRLQNRHWSGDQLMVDGTAIVHIVYLDEQRKCMRTLEFTQPFSCVMCCDKAPTEDGVEIRLTCKYLTCRAVNPRRIEVRGAIAVTAEAECAVDMEIADIEEGDGLHIRAQSAMVSVPGRIHEKIVTISESLEFDPTLPPAEMLLGGECCAVIKESKLLSGKAILKGVVYVHQLYTNSQDGSQTHSLDYTIPFSQVVDIPGAADSLLCRTSVQVLSDTERCGIGPDGENTILDISAKLLLQLQVYETVETVLVDDAYHCQYPLDFKTEEITCTTLLGQWFEEIKHSIQMPVRDRHWKEIVDVWCNILDYQHTCKDNCVHLQGRLQIEVIARDLDGELIYHETVEEFRKEFSCHGNMADATPTIFNIRYRVDADVLDILAQMAVCITDRNAIIGRVVSDWQVCKENPYPAHKATALIYYAEPGESVWDIAKKCHASPQSVSDENGIDVEIITDKMVLIVPMIS